MIRGIVPKRELARAHYLRASGSAQCGSFKLQFTRCAAEVLLKRIYSRARGLSEPMAGSICFAMIREVQLFEPPARSRNDFVEVFLS